jgi:uncharacterized membrane protein YfbV (UPF0208 family)
VSKKVIIIAAAAGAFSFAGAFSTAWFTRPAAATAATDQNAPSEAASAQATATSQARILPTIPAAQADETAGTRAMTEQQLKDLSYEVREKIHEYNDKLKALEKEKERLAIAQQVLKKDIDTLNNLRVDLAATAAGVKSERDMLSKARTEVEHTEKTNLLAIAAAYDKMDAASAGQILVNMAMGQPKSGGGARTANVDDAVKILHFMQDRTKAKVLAEIVTTQPALAATLCQKLKQVTETK